MSGFKQFLLRGNVVDLAVAVVMGIAFNAVVQAFIKDLITPLIAAIGGQPNFAGLSVTLNHSHFLYGDFINVIISFLILAAVIYFFVVAPYTRLMTHFQPAKKDAPVKECPYCVSSIPESATRCPFCTSQLSGAA